MLQLLSPVLLDELKLGIVPQKHWLLYVLACNLQWNRDAVHLRPEFYACVPKAFLTTPAGTVLWRHDNRAKLRCG